MVRSSRLERGEGGDSFGTDSLLQWDHVSGGVRAWARAEAAWEMRVKAVR